MYYKFEHKQHTYAKIIVLSPQKLEQLKAFAREKTAKRFDGILESRGNIVACLLWIEVWLIESLS